MYLIFPEIATIGLGVTGVGFLIVVCAISTYFVVNFFLRSTLLKDSINPPVVNPNQSSKNNETDLVKKLGKILEPTPNMPVLVPAALPRPNPTLLRLHNLFRQIKTIMFPLPSWTFETLYSKKLSEIGLNNVYNDILKYLETQYKNAPATLNGVPLPLEFDNNLNENSPQYKPAYYQNTFHTAYRCLDTQTDGFNKCNPWGGTSHIHCFSDTRAKTAMIWLAITDENTVIPNGSTRDDLKIQFATTCANIMRAHNFDHNFHDNNKQDYPDCPEGTDKQLNKFINHLNFLKPQLDIAIVKEMFRQSVISSNTEGDGVFDFINALEKEHLVQLSKAINKFAMDDADDPLTLEDNHALALIGLTGPKIQLVQDPIAPAMQRFLNECKKHFGWAEFSGPLNPPLQFDKTTHTSYEAYAVHLRTKALGFFAKVILDKVDGRLKELNVLRPGLSSTANS